MSLPINAFLDPLKSINIWTLSCQIKLANHFNAFPSIFLAAKQRKKMLEVCKRILSDYSMSIIYPSQLWATQWRADKCFTTGWLMAVCADSYGVKTPSMTHFKLPRWWFPSWSWKEYILRALVNSYESALAHPRTEVLLSIRFWEDSPFIFFFSSSGTT